MARVVVEVMPKPEILDPQGKAVTEALQRLGYTDLAARQGKRFDIEVDGEITDARLAEISQAAETLLANTVIETFRVRTETDTGGWDGSASDDRPDAVVADSGQPGGAPR